MIRVTNIRGSYFLLVFTFLLQIHLHIQIG